MVIMKGRSNEEVKEYTKYRRLREIAATIIKESGLEREVELDDEFTSPMMLCILKKAKKLDDDNNDIYVNVMSNEIEVTNPKLNDLALRLAQAYEEVYGKDSFTLKGNYKEE